MVSSDEVWEIIQSKANISGAWRHWSAIWTSFSNEQVFVTIHENFLDYTIRIILFDKPQKWGKGNLHIFKVSDCWTLNGAKNEVEEIKSELKDLSQSSYNLPILSFLKSEGVFDEDTFVSDLAGKTINFLLLF